MPHILDKITNGPVSLCIPSTMSSTSNLELAKMTDEVLLEEDEILLSDVMSVDPEGTAICGAATLEIPYEACHKPEFTDIVCERFHPENNQWKRVNAEFSTNGLSVL